MNDLRITGVQADLAWEDKKTNIKNFETLLTPLAGSTDVIVLPEMFATGFTMNNEQHFDTMNGDTVEWMKQIASDFDCSICGSLIISENAEFYNRLIWAYPDGRISYYDKKHLFNLSGEGKYYSAGSERIMIEYKEWKICPLICYDLRFPEWARNQGEYDLLIYVANWPMSRSLHWQSLLRARAIENQTYVLGVNRVGKDGNKLSYSGDSGLYDYSGEELKSFTEKEVTFNYKLSLKSQNTFRQKLPFLKDQDNIDYRFTKKTN